MVDYFSPLALALTGMDAYSSQCTGERHLFPDYSQRSGRLAYTNEPNISWNIYGGRTSLMAGKGMFNSFDPPDILANSNATFTKDTIIMVPYKKRIIPGNRQVFGDIRGNLCHPDVLYYLL